MYKAYKTEFKMTRPRSINKTEQPLTHVFKGVTIASRDLYKTKKKTLAGVDPDCHQFLLYTTFRLFSLVSKLAHGEKNTNQSAYNAAFSSDVVVSSAALLPSALSLRSFSFRSVISTPLPPAPLPLAVAVLELVRWK